MVKTNQIQLSSSWLQGGKEQFFLSVLAKRTYRVDVNGFCVYDGIDDGFEYDTKYYYEKGELMAADYELYPYKPLTDVIVKGSVKGNGKAKVVQAVVEVGSFSRLQIQATGKRMAYRNGFGEIRFSEPDILADTPLRYDYAYGGFDAVAEEKLQPVPASVQNAFPGVDFDYASEFRYPRNPCGKGYVVENSARIFENLELPILEEPYMPLTPSNIVVGKPENWVNQPLPRATDWVNMAWFPRIAYFGIIPLFEKKALKGMLPELSMRQCEPDIINDKILGESFNVRGANGASLGLQVAHLKGGESIRLENIHPQKQQFVLQLPKYPPRIWVDGRNGKLLETQPVMQTIIIYADEGLVTIIWQGTGKAIRPYMEEELKIMPFKIDWR
jgi:hypothetical protein